MSLQTSSCSKAYPSYILKIPGSCFRGFFLKERYPLDGTILFVLVLLTLGNFIALSVLHSRLKPAPVLCSGCGNPMKLRELNPHEETPGFHRTIPGDNGRLYVQAARGSAGGTNWYRLFRTVRECERCKRCLVVNPEVLKSSGPSIKDVEEAERKAVSIDHAGKRLQGKRLIPK